MTKSTLASLVVLGVMAATSFTALADERDKKTVITTTETLMVPGKLLPPGKYVMKLLESPNRNIVTIFNEDQSKLETMFIAFPNYKVNRTEGTMLTFWETPAGSPRALRAWFWPGDNFGQEFAYPKDMAETIARNNNNAKVASYETGSAPALTETQLAVVPVQNTPEPVTIAAAPVYTPPAPEPVVTQPAPEPEPVAVATNTTPETTLLAQNTPAPAPVTSDTVSSAPTELPQTASPLSWVMLAGLISLAFAVTMRQVRA